MSEPDPHLTPRPNNQDLPWQGSGYGARHDVGTQFRGPLRVIGAVVVLLAVVLLIGALR